MKMFKAYEMKRLLAYITLLASLMLSAGCATTTPLMTAAEQGNVHVVGDLLNKGADINEKGEFDSTALRQAAEMGHIGVVKLLLDRGADVNAKDYGGDTPLMVASIKGHTDIARLLLDRGANIHSKNNKGWTALAYASTVDMAKLLVGKGSDIHAKNNHGATILSAAVMSDRDDVAKYLIDKGADLENALSRCEDTLKEWSKLSYMKSRMNQPRHCVSFLTRIKAEREESRRQEQELAKAKAIEAQKAKDMKEIIREVVAETAKSQKQTSKSPATPSEIDKPNFAASERIMGDNDVAVIIGIEGYSSLPKSDYSYDDARLVKEYAKALGFRERNIELITDEKATKTTIEKVLEVWLKNKAKPNSRIFVYYSGHGSPDPSTGESYIVPYDGDPSYLSVTGYPLKRLYEKLGSLPAKEVIVVLDACFSGAGGRSVLARGARPLVLTTATAVSYPNMAILSATQGAQISTSSPERGHGVFTYYFLKALNEGKTNVADIYESIQPQIEDEAKQLNVQQSPTISPDSKKLKGRFVLRK
jgi:ankyrin repeat protein